MNKLKRYLAIILTVIMTVSVLPAFAISYSDVKNTQYSIAVDTLSSIGVITGYADGTFKPERNVTRAEFVAMTLRLLGYNENIVTGIDDMEFADVTKEHWAHGVTIIARSKGLIQGNGSNNFNPNDNVTMTDAMVILTNALGYYQYAKDKGGYPYGYLFVAGQIGLTKSIVEQSEALTRGQTALLLHNALSVQIYNGDEITNTTPLDLLKLDRGSGIITAVPGVRSRPGKSFPDGYIEIDGTSFVCNEDYSDYLGYSVDYYYREDGTEYELVALLSDKNTIEEFEADDVSSINGLSITYRLTDDGVRTDTIDLSDIPVIIYNGAPISLDDISNLPLDAGSYRFLDNNRDGNYDYAFIKQYFTGVINTIDTVDEVIYFKNMTPKNRLVYNEAEISITVDGVAATLADVKAGQVALYAESFYDDNKKIELKISSRQIVGIIEGISNDEIIISGTTVKNSPTRLVYMPKKLVLGAVGKISLDTDGYAATFEEVRNSEESTHRYGIVLRVGIPNNTMELPVIRIYEFKNAEPPTDFAVYEFTETVRLNGIKESALVVANYLINYRKNVIKYYLNSEGKINRVVTPTPFGTETVDGDSLYYADSSMAEGFTEYRYKNDPKLFFATVKEKPDDGSSSVNVLRSLRITQDTLSVQIPNSDDLLEEIKYYGVQAWDGFQHDKYYYIRAYDPDEFMNCGIVLFTKGISATIDQDDPAIVVDELAMGINEEGETFNIVKGYEEGTLKSWYVSEDIVSEFQSMQLTRGDVIRLATDSRGYASKFQLLFKADGSDTGAPQIVYNESPYVISGSGDINKYYHVLAGGSYYHNDETLVLLPNFRWRTGETFDDAKAMKYATILTLSGARVYIIDKEVDRVSMGTAAQINDIKAVGSDADVLYLRLRYGVLKDVFIYKNYKKGE